MARLAQSVFLLLLALIVYTRFLQGAPEEAEELPPQQVEVAEELDLPLPSECPLIPARVFPGELPERKESGGACPGTWATAARKWRTSTGTG